MACDRSVWVANILDRAFLKFSVMHRCPVRGTKGSKKMLMVCLPKIFNIYLRKILPIFISPLLFLCNNLLLGSDNPCLRKTIVAGGSPDTQAQGRMPVNHCPLAVSQEACRPHCSLGARRPDISSIIIKTYICT